MNEKLKREFADKTMSAGEAMRLIKNDDVVYIGTCTSVANGLLEALWEYRDELENVTLAGALIETPAEALVSHKFNYHSYFFGSHG